ncbi:hypothetical protein KM914_08235 [Virgibacillus pantothenticus]|uniref:hypothetical protein n=1 Tax=Virgibacillus pantothenticus TaxID=1473 RepID=UPI001BCA8019|nr:hypothetical protein [Virgibacillus pantothenticus]MBU8566416.1 hypothetical protein [Virgibacillus pantothenticus]MBU8600169.1 hypothetical protein [Virgibacillus pantothenticus]MBU8633899.1 hypothetical protein [Virgibacillus pantothenticus]MBU8641892.1 hypothetical protein [Virgibacillus pantothenticus]MBU8645676.1 hypothetical protein [Virgibacillus pantothenticus]
MPSTTVLMTIAINVISFVVGFLAYYLTSNLSSTAKRKNLELMISYLINLVLFIWVAKVVLQLPLFLSDPIAVLAYPSDAQAFYLALILLAIQISYQVKKNGLQIQNLLVNYIPVLIVASFTYHFMDIVWHDNPLAWGNFVLMILLLLLFLLLRERIQDHILLISLTISWMSGKLILSYLLPFTTIFRYMIHPLFLITVGMISLIIFIFKRKRVSS